MSKHTPGPWSVVEYDHAICVQTESSKKTKFGASRYAAIGGFDRSDPAQLAEARANARLIAAAPELLAFAQEWISKQGSDENYMTKKARAAIAKATEAKP